MTVSDQPKSSGPARWVLAVVVAAVVGVAGTAVWRADQATARAREALSAAQESAHGALESLTVATVAATELTTDVVQSAADAGLLTLPNPGDLPVTELDEVLGTSAAGRVEGLQGDASELLSGPLAVGVDQVPARAKLEARTVDLLALSATADGLAAELTMAATELAADLDAHLLALAAEGYATARTQLGDAITAASAVLGESEGRVLDDGSRIALTDAINAAQNQVDASVDGQDRAALTQAATDLTAHTETLNGAVAAVQDATTVWQAEQERLAAEQAAAQAAAARATGSSSGSGGGSKATNGGSNASRPGTRTGGGTGTTPSLPRLGSNPGSHTGDGTVNCTTPNCGIIF